MSVLYRRFPTRRMRSVFRVENSDQLWLPDGEYCVISRDDTVLSTLASWYVRQHQHNSYNEVKNLLAAKFYGRYDGDNGDWVFMMRSTGQTVFNFYYVGYQRDNNRNVVE